MIMIDFNELHEVKVPEKIRQWCETHGNNHLSLLSAWDQEPEYAEDLTILFECLAWAVVQGKKSSAARIMGKYRRLRQMKETEAFELYFGDVPDCLL